MLSKIEIMLQILKNEFANQFKIIIFYVFFDLGLQQHPAGIKSSCLNSLSSCGATWWCLLKEG